MTVPSWKLGAPTAAKPKPQQSTIVSLAGLLPLLPLFLEGVVGSGVNLLLHEMLKRWVVFRALAALATKLVPWMSALGSQNG